jgi:hypothetical protein
MGGYASRIEPVLDEISILKEEYVDCASCPPDRNCCVFSGRYVQFLEASLAKAAFGEEGVERLIETYGLRFDPENKDFIMENMRCPVLSTDNSCRIHEQKEELGLRGCLEFPIYYARGFRVPGMREPASCIMADYRCSSIEREWHDVEKKLQKIEREMFIPVRIAFYDNANTFRRDPLMMFSWMKKRKDVQVQRMSMDNSENNSRNPSGP